MSEEPKPAARLPEPVRSRPLGPPVVDRAGHLGFVAHELRNPLATALWSSELLGRLTPEERASARGAKLVGLSARALGRLQVLVEDHLLCERLDAGGYPLQLAAVEVAPLVQAALKRLEHAPAPELRLPAGLAGHGDRALLERAVEGVLAVAGRGGARVQVAGEAAGGQVRLSFRGAPVERVEDPVKGSLSDPAGRALSLPLARRIAEVHGGALTVDLEGYLLVFPAT